MSNSIKSEIEAKIAHITFSDNSNLLERSSEIIVKGSDVGFSVEISGVNLVEAEKIRDIAISKLKQIKNIEKISIILTASTDHSASKKVNSKIILDNIDKIILIAAGKGGVGKSTISALIAQKLSYQGKKVGLLDADIYGPSIPNIFGTSGKPKVQDKRMIPLESHGVKINSIGFITAPEASISWRGPMTSKALYQLMSLTKWGKLDYLIIDTPPGTGDIHLSLLQNYAVAGVIMVTTPQRISAIDVTRAINLYKKFSIPIIGIVENMSYYMDCDGQKIHIFSGNSGSKISQTNHLPLLGRIPLSSELSEACDEGKRLDEHFHLIDWEESVLQIYKTS